MSNRSRSGGSANDTIPFRPTHSLEPSKIIGLFEELFKFILASPDLEEFIQAVKGDLFNRDYLAAFGTDDKRFAYVSRWSPARALSYSSLFASLDPIKQLLADPHRQNRVLCVGGGAASELVGLGAVFSHLKRDNPTSPSNLQVDIVDIADWSSVVSNITNYMKKNWLFDGAKLDASFLNKDVLQCGPNDLHYDTLDLITLLFTTNELFCEKRAETIKFLQALNAHCSKGCYLLIAESAGSYSHITIGTKKFPVQFLIDTVLVGKPGADNGAWEIVEQSESCWYRIDQRAVKYNMKLENMRFFYRLYRKR